MKKIISILMAFSVAMSVVTVSKAAIPEVKPEMSVELVGVPATLEVGSTFTVKVKYSGVPVSENEEDWAGVGFSAAQFKMLIPGYGEYFTKSGKTYHTDPLGTAASSAATKNLEDNGQVSYGWAGASTADTIYRVGAGDVYTLNLKVLKVPTSDVKFELTEALIKAVEFDAEEKKLGEAVYEGDKDTLNVVSATLVVPTVDDDDTAEKMNDGVLVEGGLHDGKTSATTSVFEGASVTSIKVKDSDGKEQTASLPELLGNGYTKIMTVILYNANEMAGKTFNVEYFAGEEVVKTYTYKVPSSN